MGQLSKDRLDKVREVSYKYFDWMTVLADAGITEVQDLDDQLLLRCPLHEDKRPSFRVRLHEHDCHCFSCGYWGKVIDLMYELSGKTVGKAQFFENILKRTPAMQQELGFTSLYIDAYTIDPGFEGRRRFSVKNHIGSGMPLSVLSTRVRSEGDTWKNLVYSLTLLQEGESPENILAGLTAVSSVNKSNPVSEISLAELLEEKGSDDT